MNEFDPRSQTPPRYASESAQCGAALLASLRVREAGNVYVEYLILMALVGLASIGAARKLHGSIRSVAEREGNQLEAMLVGGPAASHSSLDGLSPDPLSGAAPAAPPLDRERVRDLQRQPPARVQETWASLSPAQQERAIQDFPKELGGLDGIPAAVRDRANRAALEQDLNDARAAAARPERGPQRGPPTGVQGHEQLENGAEQLEAERRVAQLEGIKNSLDQVKDKDGMLLGYSVDQPGRDGTAIIALGDPDRARHTAVYVPGNETVTAKIGTDLERVGHLHTAAGKNDESVSTIMWLGYDAPSNGPSVLTDGRSRDGAGPLQNFASGLRATHQGEPGHLTAVGHSYGSTVIAEAMRGDGLHVDDVIVVGSPGMHADHVSELTDDPSHVWVGASATDPFASAGSHSPVVRGLSPFVGGLQDQAERIHGPSPQNPEFGANEFTVQNGDHGAYWNDGSDSLMNQAKIITGKYSEVETVHAQRPPDRK